jgi:hypothetical protein
MLDKFFGVHPHVIRSGLWSKMRPGEKDLLIYLLEESERHCTRELKRTDAEVSATVGAATRTLCDARKKLSERGLIQYRRTDGGKFLYTICNPETQQPYAGDPRQPITCHKRRATSSEQPAPAAATAHSEPEANSPKQAPEVSGLRGLFQ